MKKRNLLTRGICLLAAVVLLLLFCSTGHACVDEHCPVCLLLSAWKTAVACAAMAAGIVCLRACGAAAADAAVESGADGQTLVTLKVKLSD